MERGQQLDKRDRGGPPLAIQNNEQRNIDPKKSFAKTTQRVARKEARCNQQRGEDKETTSSRRPTEDGTIERCERIRIPRLEVGDRNVRVVNELLLDPLEQGILERGVLVEAKAEVTEEDPAEAEDHLRVTIDNV